MRWYMDAGIGALAAVGVIAFAQVAAPSRTASAAPVVQAMTWTGPSRALAAGGPAQRADAPADEHVFWEPTPGYGIISPFGYRKLPWEAQGRLHQGVDIAAPAGTYVLLIADGVVLGAGEAPGYGRYVEVEHADGLRSFYAHMSAIAPYARPGAPLRAGAPIGLVGSTGSSTGAHLHLEVSHRGRPLNPAYFVGRRYRIDEGLPLQAAARVPPGVRIASVSRIPASKRELMAARDEALMAPRKILAVVVERGAGEAAPSSSGRSVPSVSPAAPSPPASVVAPAAAANATASATGS